MLLCVLFVSCSGDMKDIRRFERQSPPNQEIVGAHVKRSERGVMQMSMDAPLARKYTKPTERTVYSQGVELHFYNEKKQERTRLTADKAVSLDDKHIMQASGNVVVIDYTNGDTVYLEEIVWRQDNDVIYSNHAVKAINGNRVTYGDGFSSDANMTNLRITRQRGTIEINE